jgi:PAS domain S-box-containing protein
MKHSHLKDTRKILMIAILFGAIAWGVDAALDYFFLKEPFLDALLLDIPPEKIAFRALFFIFFLAMALVLSRFVYRAERPGEEHGICGNKVTEESSPFFLELIEQSAEGLAVTDLNGKVIFSNKAFARMHGYEPGELIGKNLSIFHTPEQMPSVNEANRKLIETGEFTGEVWHARRDGSVFPGWMHNTIFMDKMGRYSGIIGTLQNMAGRKQAERELKEANDRLKATLNAIPDLMFEVDRKGTIYSYHAPKQELLYAEPVKFLGEKVCEVLPKDVADIIMKAIEDAARKGWHRGAVYSLDMDGEKKWFELSISTKCGKSEEDTHFIAMARHITDRKKTEEALIQTNSLLASTIEASFDGILVVDRSGKVKRFNHRFAEMWRIPGPILATHDDKRFLEYVVGQLKDMESFLRGVEALYGKPEQESRDVIEFKDGRVFERHSGPQRFGDDIVGRVWTFRDVTKKKNDEDAAR